MRNKIGIPNVGRDVASNVVAARIFDFDSKIWLRNYAAKFFGRDFLKSFPLQKNLSSPKKFAESKKISARLKNLRGNALYNESTKFE